MVLSDQSWDVGGGNPTENLGTVAEYLQRTQALPGTQDLNETVELQAILERALRPDELTFGDEDDESEDEGEIEEVASDESSGN